jgi:hypothetical protein
MENGPLAIHQQFISNSVQKQEASFFTLNSRKISDNNGCFEVEIL